ncbi:MAG: hypothetical protein HN494_07765 [Opitutae bacterium]|jgi:hypothetical protein|nr:hypothetical protein [Opitutae bacterium]MBT5908812.1 hypothetical protein [Opitutae bacterium]MBT6852404.1 hypothetical protein [Opitutae bacterium]MBT7742340.1 hypothetical protein [Opitutae bacterium]MBT7925249.1 hypothetical protein [Opitutae bacterium]
MKALFVGIIFSLLTAWVHADKRPTIDSLVGKQIYIEDAFAGQSFTLLKGLNGDKDYKVEWIRHGSAVPAIRSQTCKVRLDGKYQYRFTLDHPEEKNGEFTVSISAKDDIKVYLNGVRIHVDWKEDGKTPF